MPLSMSRSQLGGVSMGAVLGMFWMRVVLGFSYLQIGFFMIFPLSLTLVVLVEERSLGPILDPVLLKVHSLIWMAMNADDDATSTQDDAAGCRASDPNLDAHFKASNTSDLITSANSSLFSGIQIDLIDHAVAQKDGAAAVYLQDTTTGLFLKYAEGKIKLTASPDDACLFEWVKGRTHHWGLVSAFSRKFMGQNMLSQIIASARKLQNWESFRVLQDGMSDVSIFVFVSWRRRLEANLPPLDHGLSCPVYLILCSARFGKGMWLSSRGRDDDKLVVGMTKQFNLALSVRYATTLDAFSTALPPDLPSSSFPASFHEATTHTPVLTHQLVTSSSSFRSLSLFADAYDTLLPEHQAAWQVHAALGNVRQVTYPLHHLFASCVAHEFHNYRIEGADNARLVFLTKLVLSGGLVAQFAIEVEYRLRLVGPSSSASDAGDAPPTTTTLQLDCNVGVHWSTPSMFQRYVDESAHRAAHVHAQHLVTLLEHQTPPRVVTNLGTLFVTSLHQLFDTPTFELSVPWTGPSFFESPLRPVYAGLWPLTPEAFLERMVVDATWFFRKRDERTRPSTLDMSPWSPHPTLGHVRVQRFTTIVHERTELVEEYQTFVSPEPNTLQIGRKIYLAHHKPWTIDIRWDFELHDDDSSHVACAIAFHWKSARATHVDTEKRVVAVMLASVERLQVLMSGQEEIENMPWPDELTAPLVQAMTDPL
ncbi:Aste57867_15784 [Aphanomyces stellatus]|uniref:Aste57867_15784 protein n=1 Tax=Aphanomyces stellatus TaxID=120398 RepID=A0A485L485_9STRA|nr:hypothetical protein As57867_015728 [Aphanomyces stellatus]VFT92572.1 Aste57867_15784 [Aphanomyces stellatus]